MLLFSATYDEVCHEICTGCDSEQSRGDQITTRRAKSRQYQTVLYRGHGSGGEI